MKKVRDYPRLSFICMVVLSSHVDHQYLNITGGDS